MTRFVKILELDSVWKTKAENVGISSGAVSSASCPLTTKYKITNSTRNTRLLPKEKDVLSPLSC